MCYELLRLPVCSRLLNGTFVSPLLLRFNAAFQRNTHVYFTKFKAVASHENFRLIKFYWNRFEYREANFYSFASSTYKYILFLYSSFHLLTDIVFFSFTCVIVFYWFFTCFAYRVCVFFVFPVMVLLAGCAFPADAATVGRENKWEKKFHEKVMEMWIFFFVAFIVIKSLIDRNGEITFVENRTKLGNMMMRYRYSCVFSHTHARTHKQTMYKSKTTSVRIAFCSVFFVVAGRKWRIVARNRHTDNTMAWMKWGVKTAFNWKIVSHPIWLLVFDGVCISLSLCTSNLNGMFTSAITMGEIIN